MGTLVAWRYRTHIALKLADHTYVTCGNGAKRWKCWGGKTGGSALIQGSGGTKQADAIAELDERAGITCYLINGVCHQAANRILFPAGITVQKAKGYYLSESLFGTYGRPRGAFGTCKAPFDRHTGVSGDLPECAATAVHLTAKESDSVAKISSQPQESEQFRAYLNRVNDLYASSDMETLAFDPGKSARFQLRLFEELVDFKLDSTFLRTGEGANLMEVRGQVEEERASIEDSFGNDDMSVDEFVDSYNSLTKTFQHQLANILKRDEYTQLLDLDPDDTLILGDIDIAREYYGAQ